MNADPHERDDARPQVLAYHRPEPEPETPSRPLMSRRDWIILSGIIVVIVVILLAISIILPRFGASKEGANRRKCARHLQAVCSAIQIYVADHQRYPPDLIQTLINADADAEVLVCPSSNDDTAPGRGIREQAVHLSKPEHCSYIYLGAGLTPATTTPDTILVVEKPTNHEGEGVHILHADGRVEWVQRGPKMDAIVAATTRPGTVPSSMPGTGGSR